MEINNKISKLKGVLEQLKKEFVGLDNIIDNIGLSITPWYVTPEIIERPVVISLWGMTGTGKTSMVNRLIELLDLSNHSITFDCGAEASDSGSESVSDKINSYIKTGDVEVDVDNLTKDLIYIFDEFQYARTLNENGEEEIKSNFRPVWNIIDSGIVKLTSDNNYESSNFINFLEDISDFAKKNPNIELKNGIVENRDEVKEVLCSLGFFYYDRGVPGMSIKDKYSTIHLDENEEELDQLRPLNIIEDRTLRILIRKLRNKFGTIENLLNEINKFKHLSELVEFLESVRDEIIAPKIINSSKALVFILGNLDEAFRVESDTNPDMDADIFYDQTSKVTISDIKDALKSRFRAEQIARFGNNIIKYPTLKKEHFEKIIEKEINRITDKFKEETEINLTVNDGFKKLLYSEGVYPVQGVRPILTTIGTIFTPLLSDILIEFNNFSDVNKNVQISVGIEDFRTDNCEIEIIFDTTSGKRLEVKRKEIELTLGKLRNPKSRKTRCITSVHEAGHAIVMAYTTGKLPKSIVSISTDRGGFCITYNSEKTNEIKCRKDIENEIMIGFGGYEAEHIIYKDRPEMTLLGSSCDLEENWECLSDAVYNNGYFDPVLYSNLTGDTGNRIPGGANDIVIKEQIQDEFKRLKNKTDSILEKNIKLLVKTALYLKENGTMNEKTFMDYIHRYGNTLDINYLRKAEKENSEEYYEDILLKLDK